MKPMLNLLKAFSLVCLTFIVTIPTYGQGPWAQEKGTAFLQLQTTLQLQGTYNGLIRDGRAIDDTDPLNRNISSSDLGIYGVYGVSDKFTIIGHLPFKYVASGTQVDSLTSMPLLEEGSLIGLSNVYLAAKYRLWDKGVKAAVSIQTHLNTGSNDLDKGLTTGYLANFFGGFLHVGGGITPKLYAFADIGYVVATNGYSDYSSIYAEVGYEVIKGGYIILNTTIKTSTENGDFDNAGNNLLQTGLYPNDQDWIGLGGKLLYELDNKIGFTLGTASIIRANYTGFVAPVTFGVYKKW